MAAIRCFLAISLPEALCDALSEIAESAPAGRPVPPDNLHLTLSFLGEISEDDVVAVHEALLGLRSNACSLELEGLDLFGGKTPKILFAGVRRNPALSTLHASVRSRLVTAGMSVPRERFRPHVTLVRFNRPPGRDGIARLGRFLQAHALTRFPAFEVNSLSLFRSDLGRGPAVHTELATYPLG